MNKVVLITGSSGGIGIECVKKFVLYKYTICSVDTQETHELSGLVKQSGGKHYTSNVADYESAQCIAKDVVNKYGNITVLVTCAGITDNKSILNITPDEWRNVIEVNLFGTFNYVKAVSSYMKEQKYGTIVTISSTVTRRARRNILAYTASKSAIIGLTKASARDLGRFNINVNCIMPGLALTKLVTAMPEELREKIKEETCLGRIAHPKDIADSIWLLCQNESRHITGEVIRVDGGQLS